MNGNSSTPRGLDVPKPRGESTSNLNSYGSSRLTSPMASSITTQDATPTTTPTEQANRSTSNSSTSSSSHSGSARSTGSPWDKKYLLTLDGGGVRGLSTLLIIQHLIVLCHSFEQSQDPRVNSSYHPIMFQEVQGSGFNSTNSSSAQFLPVHYFDYIAGTSTGGLIAIMLSRLRMGIDDCIQEYENLGAKAFEQPRKFSMRGPITWNQEKYHHKLEKVIKDVVKKRDWKEDQSSDSVFSSNEDHCRTIVLAVRENSSANAPYLFRTYEHVGSPIYDPQELNPGPPSQNHIWEVARATTAAPTYFKPMRIGEERF
ncbi:hypothetical protein DSL72_009399 [Monilinia vaccinii-corymbosi]|uniref:PNPLA domain-containing protein n=1 Tax=Monilinia vaccinii-corymbosi TaxID=61207 RepID=A0A8A3PR08_9HELO|nr:hypothetical protein DSL72_009399 [Monilinia vaccinii-corymbosi]